MELRQEIADRLAKIKAMWKAGKSTGQIGRELNITRAAVIGQIKRHGIARDK